MNTSAKSGLKSRGKGKPGERRLRPMASSSFAPAREPEPALDPRLVDLLLDALTNLQAFVWSRTAGLPYVKLRNALRFNENDRAQINNAAQSVAASHAEWCRKRGAPAFFLATLAATQVAHLDALLADEIEPPADARERYRQLLWGLFFAFLPLLIFGAIFFLGKWGKKP